MCRLAREASIPGKTICGDGNRVNDTRVLSGGPSLLFKGIEVGATNAIVVFAAASQIQRREFFLLYPLIDALFMDLEFSSDLFNCEFYRSFSHRTIPSREFFP